MGGVLACSGLMHGDQRGKRGRERAHGEGEGEGEGERECSLFFIIL